MTALTARQSEILAAITAYWRDHQRPPSIRELCDALDIASPNGMTTQLRLMEQKGAIERECSDRERGGVTARAIWPKGARKRIRAIFGGG